MRRRGELNNFRSVRTTKSGNKEPSKSQQRRNEIGDLYDCVTNIGVSLSAQHLGVTTEELRNMWFGRVDIPDDVRNSATALREAIQERKKKSKQLSTQLQLEAA